MITKKVSSEELKTFRRKVSLTYEAGRNGKEGEITASITKDDYQTASLSFLKRTFCCGLAEFGSLDAYSDEGRNSLLLKMCAIKGMMQKGVDNRRKVIVTGNHNQQQWKDAFLQCGFEEVGEPFTNSKTGNRVWVLHRTRR
jgi:hypothetical protein